MTGLVDLYATGEALEAAALALVVRVGPWLGPAPTAYLVYERTLRHLAWPQWVSVAAGLTLECLGVASSATALKFWAYNADKLKSEPSAPTRLALGVTGLYFVAALFLTVVLDTAEGVARYAPVAFPVLSLASVSLLALRLAHPGAFMSKEQRRAMRKVERALTAQVEPQPEIRPVMAIASETYPATSVSDNGHRRSFEDFERAVSGDELELAGMTGDEVAEWAGVSASTGRRWKRKLKSG